MKPTRKDFFMEIKKSLGRFLSILFIVALGVAFFSGIRSAEPDMRITGDRYYDDTDLMDIKVLSTLGLTDDDLEALKELDGIEQVTGTYSKDFLQVTKDDEFVLHVMAMVDEVNIPALSEGRMPEKVGECLADDETTYQIGDVIHLSSGNDDPVTDTLKTDTLTVVGRGNTPCYISFNRGSTNIGRGSINAFLLVPEETFDIDVYTEAYVKVAGAEEQISYTKPYENLVEGAMDNVKAIKDERQTLRRDSLVKEAFEKLADAKKELADGKKEAEEKLSDAAKKIADGKKELSDAKDQITDGKKQIADAKKTLQAEQKKIDSGKKEYEAGLAQYEAGLESYNKGKEAFDASKGPALEEIRKGKEQIAGLEALIKQDEEAFEATDDPQTAAMLSAKIQAEKQMLAQAKSEVSAAENELATAEATLEATKAQLDQAAAALVGVPEQLKAGQKKIDEAWKELEKEEKKLKQGEADLKDGVSKIKDAEAQYEEGKREAEEEIADGEEKIAEAEEKINDIDEAKWYIYDRSTLPEYNGYGENADRMRAIGKVFPVLFFLVAALISLTSMTRMVEEQRTIIGTMKALGYGKWDIAKKYLGYAFLATSVGSVIGVLIGEKLLPYIIIYAYSILYHHTPGIIIPYNLYYGVMASGIAISCVLVATLFACYRALESQPAILMRPPVPKKGKKIFLERIPFIWKRFNFSWKSTIRNMLRYKKRFFMTVFGIGGCMGLMLFGFGLKDSIFEIATEQYKEIQLYHGMVYLQEDATEEELSELDASLRADADVKQHIDTRMQSVTAVNDKREREVVEVIFQDATKLPDYVTLRDRITQEGYSLDDEGVVICEKTAKLLELKVGDEMEIKDEDAGNKKVKVAAICENYLGHYMYFTPAYYEKIYGESPETNCIIYTAKDDATKEEIEEIGKRALDQDTTLGVSYVHEIQKRLDDMLGSLNLVIIVLIVSAGMLAFVVLYNLNNINITERQRELATLKVLGFHDPEVGMYVFRENFLLTFFGAFVGIWIGKFLHLFIIETVEVESAMFGRIINPSSYLFSFLWTVFFSIVVNIAMYFKLKKIDMVESLKSIE